MNIPDSKEEMLERIERLKKDANDVIPPQPEEKSNMKRWAMFIVGTAAIVAVLVMVL